MHAWPYCDDMWNYYNNFTHLTTYTSPCWNKTQTPPLSLTASNIKYLHPKSTQRVTPHTIRSQHHHQGERWWRQFSILKALSTERTAQWCATHNILLLHIRCRVGGGNLLFPLSYDCSKTSLNRPIMGRTWNGQYGEVVGLRNLNIVRLSTNGVVWAIVRRPN